MLERQIQKTIQDYLKSRGAFVFKVIAANRNGIPDIIACLDGRFIGIEVKRPGYKPSPIQSVQIQRIEDAGGIAFVACCVDDVKKYLQCIA